MHPNVSSVLALLAALTVPSLGQQAGDNLGLQNGYINITTSSITAKIVRSSQVLASLSTADDGFDFLPFDLLPVRAHNGQYHWGDITFRYRFQEPSGGGGDWIDADSSQNRRAVLSLPTNNLDSGVVAASNLSPTLPTAGPLNITREWLTLGDGEGEGDIGLRFTISNTDSNNRVVELGSLGFPAEFNSIFTNRHAADMARLCSLSDPYVGMDAGQIRVARVSGTGKALVVTGMYFEEGNGNGSSGDGSGRRGTPLEAYRPLREPYYEDTAYGSQTFEGFYEWQVLTKAWAEKEWRYSQPWNEPSSVLLQPGEEVRFGLRFSVAEDGVRGLDAAVRRTGTPVAQAVPGYILPRDLPGKLILQADAGVKSISVEPKGSLQVVLETAGSGTYSYTVTPSTSAWGRVRVTATYSDGKTQTIHYFITKPTTDALADLGRFLTTEAWFNDTTDPFGRASSVMTYDYERRAIVKQDARAWVAGLSDEAGVGAYLAAVVKQTILPNAAEIAKLEDFVEGVLWGTIQRKEDFGVRKAVFFYDPAVMPGYSYDKGIDWGSWTSWNRAAAYAIDRAYNYVHVAAAYWALYRVARAYPSIVRNEADWYLTQAHKTVTRCMGPGVAYQDVGLMGETVFGAILKDLEREGRKDEAAALEAAMKKRAQLWDEQEIPYGSEMAWDSTGQEGVYYWSRYFGFNASAAKTVNSVLGYTPGVPHWGWNGNARRYWDFIYGGKLQRIERQIHHYGSALNAQVLLSAFRDDPADTYLLRVGYGGASGPLANINAAGFPSAAFHSFPDTLKWDGITGDYGPGFLGMALSAGTYVAEDADLGGLVAFGGVLRLSQGGATVMVQPRDAVRRRVFIGPLGLLITVDAGCIAEFSYASDGSSVVRMSLAQQDGAPVAEHALVWLESTSTSRAGWAVTTEGATAARRGWRVALSVDGVSVVDIRPA